MAAADESKVGGGGIPAGADKGDGEVQDTAEAGTMQRQATEMLRGVREGMFKAGMDGYGGTGLDVFRRNADTKPWPAGFDQLLKSKRTTSS